MEDTQSVHPQNHITELQVNALMDSGQKATFHNIIRHFRWTIKVVLFILIVGMGIQAFTENDLSECLFVKLQDISSITEVLRLLFTYLINGIFAVWVVSFMPFFVYTSFKTSKEVKSPLQDSSKWLPILASVVLTIMLFSILTITPDDIKNPFCHELSSINFSNILFSGILIWSILFVTSKLMPLSTKGIQLIYKGGEGDKIPMQSNVLLVQIIIYSVLLYGIVYVVFRYGDNAITFGAILAILLFIVTSSKDLINMIRDISVFDIRYQDALIKILKENEEERQKIEDERLKNRKEYEEELQKIKEEKSKNKKQNEEELQKIKDEKLKQGESIIKQLKEINTRQIQINYKVSEKKIELLKELLRISGEEQVKKLDEESPKIVESFEEDIKNISSLELEEKMDSIWNQAISKFDSIPKGLNNLMLEITKATKELNDIAQELNDE